MRGRWRRCWLRLSSSLGQSNEALVVQVRTSARLLSSSVLTFAGMRHCYANYLVLFCLSLALGACNKEATPAPAIDFGANEGYTGWDATRQLTSPTDLTDWTTDATWNSSELGLFDMYHLSFTQPQLPSNVWKLTAHPNPVVLGSRNQLTAQLGTPNLEIPASNLRIAYALVDARYTKLEWGMADSVKKQFGASISYHPSKCSGNHLYRMYYVIFNTNDGTVYYKGHGDIKVTP